MGKKYSNPPIIEAVCEFRLSANTQWDLTIPGLLYERIRLEFPHREQKLVQEVGFVADPQGEMQPQAYVDERVFLFSENRRLFIQVGRHILAIHALSPYPGWQEMKSKTEKAWQVLQETTNVGDVARIGLRYVNRIILPNPTSKLSEYFDFYPFLGAKLPQELVAFVVVGEFTYTERRDRCRVQLTSASPDSENTTSFLLDIDYFLTQPKTVERDTVMNWVDEAHERVEEIFEGCITDNLRKLFGEVE